jgi:putative oxidoreductase
MSPTPLKPTPMLTQTVGQRVNRLLRTAVPLLLRGSLGVTFVWFGGLKLAGEPTLPASLIAAITPFMDPDLSVPLVGAFEVALGAGLLIGRAMPVFLSAAALQLSGTFLVLLLRPDVAFVDGNPLRLSVEGEYVVKNLVLLAATASLALHSLRPQPPEAKPLRLAKARDSHQTPTVSAAMSAGLARRALARAPRFLLGFALISLGSILVPYLIGVVPVLIGLALILPKESLKATLQTAGVAHHKVGDPTGPAGVGAMLRSESGEVIGEISKSIGVSTNTVADYTALIEGLEMARDSGVDEIDVYVDSAVVAGHLVDGYGVRADHLRPLVEDVRQQFDSFQTWSLARVPRKLNLVADQLANLGISEATCEVPRPLPRSITPVRRLRRRADAA